MKRLFNQIKVVLNDNDNGDNDDDNDDDDDHDNEDLACSLLYIAITQPDSLLSKGHLVMFQSASLQGQPGIYLRLLVPKWGV